MRINCKVVVIAVCFGVFLLLYFLGGNAADDPLREEVVGEEGKEVAAAAAAAAVVEDGLSSRSPPEPARVVPAKFRKKKIPPAGGVGARAKEPPGGRKEGRAIDTGVYVNAKSKRRNNAARPVAGHRRVKEVMHLAVVACGNRLDETLAMVKSALLFSLKRITFHIFAEDSLAPQFDEKLKTWPRSISTKFQHRIYPITFSVGNADEWKKLFKPCAAQRLFLPVILKDVDSLLYVDTDVLFLRPMDDIWDLLKSFNGTQLAAMAPEHEIPKIGWYSRFARHPFYGVTGVNSGVMLMNLTRIRSTMFKNSMIPTGLSWEDILHPLYQKYKNHITWGDQDLLNIIFHYNPGKNVSSYFRASGTTGRITVCTGVTVKGRKRRACPSSTATAECITTTSSRRSKWSTTQYGSFPSRTTCSSRCSTPSRPSSWTRSTPCAVGFLKSSSSRSRRPCGRCSRTKWSDTSSRTNKLERRGHGLSVFKSPGPSHGPSRRRRPDPPEGALCGCLPSIFDTFHVLNLVS
ncbi:glucoside xylosyltransferase 2 isoform X1 [Pseudoliparis swirei]|uniref:glucoside xylosyltransferase 2 isoform X1 n=1 Tax=Pseudoliparis swirei TaxID=2059687 RepID=UPI0024BE2427|nr:glucoside xylosyltransferase 2 isoform X1 [Pseudoliparis swirei]